MKRFGIPEEKKKRVILDTDAANEVDDQFAIVQALLSESLEIRGMIAAHFEPKKSLTSEEDSYREIHKILGLMGRRGKIQVLHGAKAAMTQEYLPAFSEGSAFIVEEAMNAREDMPVYFVFLGALTDMAAAVLTKPEIVEKNIRVIWIGGGNWPEGGYEYNLNNDVMAANVVMGSDLEIWQIPRNVYRMMPVGFAELYAKVHPCGAVGQYLCDNVIAFNNANKNHPGEYRILGDSPAIGVLLYEDCGEWELRSAPQFTSDLRYLHTEGKKVMRVYKNLNSRFILEDFYAKLRLFFETKERQEREKLEN